MIEFKLFNSYRKDQAQLLLCNNPADVMRGTYIYDDEIYIYAALKKDVNINEKLNYNDKFLSPTMFQWESENNINSKKPSDRDLINSKIAHVFVRKVEDENGITQPFIYVGDGKLENPRYVEERSSLLFDISLEKELPKDLQFDFEIDFLE